MNESIPVIAPVEPSAPAYKDRSIGLMIYGVLTVLLGCLSGLLVLVMLAGQAAVARNGGPANMAAIIPAIAIYAGLGVVLICLGIGSMQARRWARALLLIFSWGWLVMGICTGIMMAFIMPKVLATMPTTANQPGVPPGAMKTVLAATLMFFGMFFVLLPGAWVFFYGNRHVKATCEARDAVPRWTDACPLPVLGLCLWLALSVPMMLFLPISYHGVIPFFGTFLTGVPGTVIYMLVAVLWGYSAWQLYLLKSRGWWLIMIGMALFIVSSLVTFSRHDMLEMYQLMGTPQAQIDQMQQMGMLTGNRMTWLMALSALPFLGYILFIKRYFQAKA